MRFSQTLKKNHEFKRLYNKGKSSANRHLALYCRRNNLKLNRVGITVGSKVGNAVKRNLIKRRLREIYRLDEDKFLRGWDMVIVARSASAFADYHQLRASLFDLSEKLKLFRTNSSAEAEKK